MRKAMVLCLISTGFSVQLIRAEKPLATLQPGSDFKLRGAYVSTAGVPNWPLLKGDTITTGSGGGTVRFADGSSVQLAPHSSARVDQSGGKVSFQLTSGASQYSTAEKSNVQLFDGAKEVQGKKNGVMGNAGNPPGRANATSVIGGLIDRGVPGKGLPNALENINKPKPVSPCK